MYRRTAGIALALLALTACGSSATSPVTGSGGGGAVVLPLAVSCPSSITTSTAAATVAVSYPAPATTGGTAPIATSCSPASGSAFPRGTNTVTCGATDAAAKTASCSFSVIVNAIPVLQGTKILAFGDSITAGEVLNAARFTVVDSTRSYPTLLQSLLLARYTSQIPVVTNRGQSGELLMHPEGYRSDDTRIRFNSELTINRPDAVLLLEGVNDLNSVAITSEQIAEVLRLMVREALAAGAKKVYLSTLTPQIPGKLRSSQAARVPGLNTLIKAVAAQEGATLVDIYAAMIGDVNNLINNDDGLHPYPAGYAVMAQTFFEALKGNFEQSVLAASSSSAAVARGLAPVRPAGK